MPNSCVKQTVKKTMWTCLLAYKIGLFWKMQHLAIEQKLLNKQNLINRQAGWLSHWINAFLYKYTRFSQDRHFPSVLSSVKEDNFPLYYLQCILTQVHQVQTRQAFFLSTKFSQGRHFSSAPCSANIGSFSYLNWHVHTASSVRTVFTPVS